MIDAAGGPSNIRPSDPNNLYPGLTNFSLLTHGFGNPVINTSLGVLQTYLQELLAYYEGRKPIHVPERRYSVFGDKSTQSLDGMGQEPVPVLHGTSSNGVHQNPLLYATRHYPGGGGGGGREEDQDSTSNGGEADVMIEVTLKDEPVDSPNTYTL